MMKAKLRIVVTPVEGGGECNQRNFKCIIIIFYFSSLVVCTLYGVLKLAHRSSWEPVVKISRIFQVGC